MALPFDSRSGIQMLFEYQTKNVWSQDWNSQNLVKNLSKTFKYQTFLNRTLLIIQILDNKGMWLGNSSSQILSETIKFDWKKSDYKSDYYFEAVIELNWIYAIVPLNIKALYWITP